MVSGRTNPKDVIPAKAGISVSSWYWLGNEDSRFRGNDSVDLAKVRQGPDPAKPAQS
jgi:hypothetical protein